MSDPDCPVMPGGPCMRRAEDDGSAWGRCRWCDRAVDYDPVVIDAREVFATRQVESLERQFGPEMDDLKREHPHLFGNPAAADADALEREIAGALAEDADPE